MGITLILLVFFVRAAAHPPQPLHDGDTTVTITFTGDILLDRGVRERIQHSGIERLFHPTVDSLFHASDLVVGNLECPVTHVRQPAFKRFVFRGDPEWLPVLRRHGFTHLNLANNHSIDQGRRGLMDTKANVEQAGMVPVGAGSDMREAARPVLLCEHPRRVWLMASQRLKLENFAYLPDKPSISQESFDSLLLRVNTLRRQEPESYIIVTLHWGWEHSLTPLPQQRQEARALIQAGADCLIGHHPHTLQPSEIISGKPVFYSIGNFIFDQKKPINSRACTVTLHISPSGATTEVHPVDIQTCIPHLLPAQP